MAIVVRRAVPKDLPVMLDIYNDEVLHGSATFDVTPKTLKERQVWFGAHTWPARPLLVATDGNCVLGYASLSDYKPKEAYAGTAEISVYVARDARGRRIGRQLVEALIEHAKREPSLHVLVSIVCAENAASLALHRKLGFREVGTLHAVGQKFGRYLDTHIWELVLEAPEV